MSLSTSGDIMTKQDGKSKKKAPQGHSAKSLIDPKLQSMWNEMYVDPYHRLNESLSASFGQYQDLSNQITNSLTSFMPHSTLQDLYTFGASREKLHLQERISSLENDVADLVTDLQEKKANANAQSQMMEQLKLKNEELERQLSLRDLLSRVKSAAQEQLLHNPEFQEKFAKAGICESFVMSIDIRRSTELMLKVKEPELFAQFITVLCENLKSIILSNYGVFDKFTGDGILAFFPDFYSGPQSGLMVAKAAFECHKCFNDIYKASRSLFTSVLKDTGLGIGIDFGNTYVSKITNALTVVGNPVVYACRMSGANAGDTLLNQQAYEELNAKYSEFLTLEESFIMVKNEGETLAYKLLAKGKKIYFEKPEWDKGIENIKKD